MGKKDKKDKKKKNREESGSSNSKSLDLRKVEMPARPKAMKPADIRSLRESLNASQALFGRLLNVSSNAVESWEQGVRQPRRRRSNYYTSRARTPRRSSVRRPGATPGRGTARTHVAARPHWSRNAKKLVLIGGDRSKHERERAVNGSVKPCL